MERVHPRSSCRRKDSIARLSAACEKGQGSRPRQYVERVAKGRIGLGDTVFVFGASADGDVRARRDVHRERATQPAALARFLPAPTAAN